MTKIDIKYNKESDDLGQCIIEMDDPQVDELLTHLKPLFEVELNRASFSKKKGITVVSFYASKVKIQRLEKVIHQALDALARLN